MRFRTVAVAAVVLMLAAVGSMAVLQISSDSRAEAAQQTIEREDSLAVQTDLRQKLVSDDDHDPTTYGENGTETVEYQGTVWEPGGNYTYYPEDGEIEFQRNESDEANISYQYDIPENENLDDQGQTVTVGAGLVHRVGLGLSFVVLLLFVGSFVARRMGVGRSNRGYRGR